MKVKREIPFFFIVLSIVFSSFSCSADRGKKENSPSDGAPPSSGERAFVISMLGESGTFGIIEVSTRKVWKAVGPLSNDAVARYWNGKIFVINRLSHDNIQVLKSTDYSLIKQYSVDPGSNPQDMAFLPDGKAYISRLASPKLLVVKAVSGERLHEIDLSHFSETSEKKCKKNSDCKGKACLNGLCAADGIPELASLHMYGKYLWIAVQRLNRNKRFAAETHGIIAILDTETNKIIKSLQTKSPNPYRFLPSQNGRFLYVGEVGKWLDGNKPVLDGAIELFDLKEMRKIKTVLTERELGGNLVDFAIYSEKLGYAIRSGGDWRTELLSFDPSKGKVLKVLKRSECIKKGACFTYFQIAINSKDELYLVDRNLKNPGIRIFSAKDGRELTSVPLDMGMPPINFIFFK